MRKVPQVAAQSALAAAPAEAVLERMRQIFDAMPDAVVTIDDAWTFTFANRRALEIVKRRRDRWAQYLYELFPGNREEPFH